MKKIVYRIAITTFCMGALLMLPFHFINSSYIVIKNKMECDLRDVEVSFDGRVIFEGEILSGGDESVYFMPRRDGAFNISGRCAGENRKWDKLGYATRWQAYTHRISLFPDRVDYSSGK